ncbi:unnamed protein product [Rhodiola kirilowii]
MQVLKPLFDAAGSSIRWESWDDVMEWRTQKIWKSKEEKEITSFIINAPIYEIWSNRNSTIFRNIKLQSSEIQKKKKEDVGHENSDNVSQGEVGKSYCHEDSKVLVNSLFQVVFMSSVPVRSGSYSER